jgi:hypothetical protein
MRPLSIRTYHLVGSSSILLAKEARLARQDFTADAHGASKSAKMVRSGVPPNKFADIQVLHLTTEYYVRHTMAICHNR